MKNIRKTKGFTLMEIIATLVILSMLILIATSSIMAISKKTKNKMFCTKVEGIVAAAVLYGQDIGCPAPGGFPCSIKIEKLVEKKYLKNDNSTNDIVDPRTKNSMLNEEIIISYENRRVYATYQYQGDDGNLCN